MDQTCFLAMYMLAYTVLNEFLINAVPQFLVQKKVYLELCSVNSAMQNADS